ncbi:AraC family transcriptional regulator [Zhouia spongiae]|uniref:AraC family transcriptional regulator n=1 Tax=Zhouia spongiae TaxID=2202721 RepID=A0ABY3YJE0_9FLAO|nr:AraC family transcriptional regulator [Zhouia spongiae]UNY97932.1 AraC family transcriptional regulator [Zhouia spongiae]
MYRKLALIILLIFSELLQAQIKQAEDYSDTLHVTERAENYLNLILSYYRQGNYKLHKVYSDSLYTISKKNNLTALQVKAMVNQAINLNMQTKYLEAIELYRDALVVARKIPDDKQAETVVLVNLGNIYNNVELYEKSIETMNLVLKQADKTEKPNLIKVAALSGLSISYSAMNDEKKALLYALQVKEIGEKTGNENVILTSLNHISNSYYKLGDYQKSIETAKKATTYKAYEKNVRVKAWLLVNLGVANFKLNNHTEAEQYLQQSLSIASEQSILEIEMTCYEYLSKVYKEQNKGKAFADAEKKYNEVRINFLDNQKEAITDELKAEIEHKDQKIFAQEKAVANLSKQQKNAAWLSLLFITGCGILFWTYSKQNKQKRNIAATEPKVEKLFNKESEKYKNSSLSEESRRLYKKKILEMMNVEKIYLNHDLNQTDFAKRLGVSSHHLSETLHYGFNKNFYQLINSYRIKEAKEILALSINKDIKILAVAFDSGFKSKTTFNRVFKEQTGYTPSEYRKKATK